MDSNSASRAWMSGLAKRAEKSCVSPCTRSRPGEGGSAKGLALDGLARSSMILGGMFFLGEVRMALNSRGSVAKNPASTPASGLALASEALAICTAAAVPVPAHAPPHPRHRSS